LQEKRKTELRKKVAKKRNCFFATPFYLVFRTEIPR